MTRSWLTAASGVEIRGESLASFSLFFHLAFSRNMYEVLYKCALGKLLGFCCCFTYCKVTGEGEMSIPANVCVYVHIMYIYGYYNIYVLNA